MNIKGEQMKKQLTRSLIILLVLMTAEIVVGCAGLHRTPNPDGTPTAPVTKLEEVNFANVQIATHNRAAAESLIAVHDAGFIETEYFDKISAGQVKITKIHQQLTPLLKSPVAANSAQIKDLLSQIKTIAANMVADGTAGIKNDISKQQVLSEVNAISSLANSIISTLTTSGILK